MRRMLKCKMPGVSLMCPSGTDKYCAGYRAVYDALVAAGDTPPDDIAAQQDLMVRALVGGGVWTLLDVFYLFAQYSNNGGGALINWINPGTYNATLHGTVNPAFVSLEGFTGNIPQSAYIDTNFNPGDGGTYNFVQNSASGGLYIRTNDGTGGSVDFGNRAGPRFRLDARSGVLFYSYTNSIANGSGGNADSRGFYVLNRDSATTNQLYKNKTDIDANYNSSGVADAKIFICCYNNAGAAVAFAARQYSLFFLGSSLSQANVNITTDAFETYMDYNGKGVI